MVRKLLVLLLETGSKPVPLLSTDKIIDSTFDRATDSWEVLIERIEDVDGED